MSGGRQPAPRHSGSTPHSDGPASRPGAAAPAPAALSADRSPVPPPGSPVLPASFYDRPVLEVAHDLVGCGFFFDGVGGRIVETEAYAHDDPCCHGFRGRTQRNAVMFGPPGHLYVYFTYGMHFCCNLVCEEEGRAAAVLLRAIEPTHGLDVMRRRRGPIAAGGRDGAAPDARVLCSGPARLTQALAIGREQNGSPAWRRPLAITPRPSGGAMNGGGDGGEIRVGTGPASRIVTAPRIVTTPRIGVGGDPAPWRFVDADSRFLSRPLPRHLRAP